MYIHKQKKLIIENKNLTTQLNIKFTEEVAYINLAIITDSHAEFVFDFLNVMPYSPKSKVKNRIILTPFHIKPFMKAMVDNVQKFKEVNATIQDLDLLEIPFNFNVPIGQA